MPPDIPVLYEDAGLVAVNKPSGLAVVPAAGQRPADSVRGRLEREIGARLWVVHRLDRETSGVLLFARTPETHRALCMAFEARLVGKTYIAFTAGTPEPGEGRIETPLHPARRGKVRPARPGEAGAWEAATRYRVTCRWERSGASVARVEACPETGRHHQIRAHLRSVGTPVLFDRVYGGSSPPAAVLDAPLSRLALHASRVVVPGLETPGDARTIEAPLPADLDALVRWLDGGWTAIGAIAWPGR